MSPAKSQGGLVNNIVMMGMGEPLANYDNLIRALEIFNSSWGLNIGARKITVSTSGLAPQIRRLAEMPQQYHLAISLHGATDEVRDKIMPINRKYPLEELISACELYQQAKGRMIWVEYILIDGVNTGLDQVEALSGLAKRLQCKVNLIPYNPVDGIELKRPSDETVGRFRDALHRKGVRVTVRIEKAPTSMPLAANSASSRRRKPPQPKRLAKRVRSWLSFRRRRGGRLPFGRPG